jgi:1-deoxy-D-xylulose-5-phosphate reductoisomerase
MRKVVILGCTGSIGTQALEIVATSDELSVVGLAADSSWEQTLEQAREHGVPSVALVDSDAAAQAKQAWNGKVLAGEEGITPRAAAARVALANSDRYVEKLGAEMLVRPT